MKNLLEDSIFLNKVASEAYSKASKESMDKFGYIVIWDKNMKCVIKEYKDGTKIKI